MATTEKPMVVTAADEYKDIRGQFYEKSTSLIRVPSGAAFRVRKMSPLQFMRFLGDAGVSDDESVDAAYKQMKEGSTSSDDVVAQVSAKSHRKLKGLLTSDDGVEFRNSVVDYVLIEPAGLKSTDLAEDDRDHIVMLAITLSGDGLIDQKKN